MHTNIYSTNGVKQTRRAARWARSPAVAEALAGFEGAGRRFERLGTTAGGALVVDDYAHHPTEVLATIDAARTLAPRRVIALFQPHLFSRTQREARAFGAALATADLAVVMDIYPAREARRGLPGRDRQARRRRRRRRARSRRLAAAATTRRRPSCAAELGPGDLLLTMGAGDVDSVGPRAAHLKGLAAGASKLAAMTLRLRVRPRRGRAARRRRRRLRVAARVAASCACSTSRSPASPRPTASGCARTLETAATEMTTLHVRVQIARERGPAVPERRRHQGHRGLPAHAPRAGDRAAPGRRARRRQLQARPGHRERRRAQRRASPTATCRASFSRAPAAGPRLTDAKLLRALAVAGAAPRELLARTDALQTGSRGVVAALRDGPELLFGTDDEAAQKWEAAAACWPSRPPPALHISTFGSRAGWPREALDRSPRRHPTRTLNLRLRMGELSTVSREFCVLQRSLPILTTVDSGNETAVPCGNPRRHGAC